MSGCATCQRPTKNTPALCDHCRAERRRHHLAKSRARSDSLTRRMRGAA